MTSVYDLTRGGGPLIVSMPHSGVDIAPYKDRMTEEAHKVPDCDWHIPELYSFLADMDVTRLKANYARYVIDLNRDPSGKSLYPGQNVTELCPTTTFEEKPVYLPGQTPNDADIADRVHTYWQPYHEALAAEIERVKEKYGYALVWDAHSIRSQVPRFFDGRLPDLNFGTNNNSTCAPSLAETIMAAVEKQDRHTCVLNGRFKGGFITRHYGTPAENIHAVQLELSQITYMNEAYPFEFEAEKADQVRPVIEKALEAMIRWKP